MTTTPAASTAPAEPKVSDLRRSLQLFRRFRGGSRVYVIGMLLLVFESATAVVEPYPIAYLIDFLQGEKPGLREAGMPSLLASDRWGTIMVLTAVIVLLAAVNSAADSLAEVCMARGGRTLGYNIRVAMYSHLQRLSLAFHDKKRTGDVLTRVTGDVLVVEEFVVASVSNIVASLLVLVGSFAVLLTQSWNVAMVALAVVPLLAFISNRYSRRIKSASKTQRSREGELASTAQEMLTSIRLVQAYGRGKVDLDRFSDQTEQSMHASLRTANVQAEFSFVIALVEALAISAVVWIGVFLLDREAITLGTLILFILLLQNMFKPARKIVSEWYKIGKVFASVERIDDLLDRRVEVRDSADAVPAPALHGRLSFEQVNFAYPVEHADGSPADGRGQVLRGVDFEVAPGEVVALVGASGAGKSTVAQLVPRLYDPDSGTVRIDGLDVRTLTLASVRSQVSLVLQDTVLLSGTVAENIGYGIPDATPDRIRAAARAANAHDFIMALPDGYETLLAERATTLSGGQRQRLSIARAFIRETPILILDEPTTGLDTESTRLVVDALRSLMRGRTTLIISHDAGLIGCADRVLRIVDGVVTEAGPPPAERSRSGPLPSNGAGSAPGKHATRRAGPTTGRAAGGHSVQPLADRLQERLPGLRRATDTDFAVEEVSRRLLDGTDQQVRSASVEKLLYRPDGTCTLRYLLRLESADGGCADRTVLARLHPDDDAATDYLTKRVGRIVCTPPGKPWSTSAAAVPGVGLALHPYPLDPGLATLAQAADPATVGRVLHTASGTDDDGQWSVHVVHHPREGGCVLRYDRGTSPAAADGSAVHGSVYGKVYGDGRGYATAQVLHSLHRADLQDSPVPRVPRAVKYVPALRLLLTEAIPGEQQLRRSLRASGAVWRGDPAALTETRAMVVAAAEVLSRLHRQSEPRPPLHALADEMDRVHRELQPVRQVWPDIAERMLRRLWLTGGAAATLPSGEPVLSHGDFTPAQLVGEAPWPALVDLDTLCLADPALDLGRFVAHLHLAGLKAAGPQTWPVLDDLSSAFLCAYAGGDLADCRGLLERTAVYRDVALVLAAARACRQLKDARFDLTCTLLDDPDDWTRRIET